MTDPRWNRVRITWLGPDQIKVEHAVWGTYISDRHVLTLDRYTQLEQAGQLVIHVP